MARKASQSLIICIKLSDAEFGNPDERMAAYELEDAISAKLEATGLGEVDGHEFGEGFATIFVDGADVDAIADVALPIVKAHIRKKKASPGSYLLKRYGRRGNEMRIPV